MKIFMENDGVLEEAVFSDLTMNTVEAVLSNETPKFGKAEKAPKTDTMVNAAQTADSQANAEAKPAKKTTK